MKNPWILIGVITVVLFGGAIWYSSVASERNNDGVEVFEHIMGNKDAAVKLVEYSDLQCPACASFHPVVQEVLTEYGDQIRFEYKHFPLPIHPYAMQAAMAAEAAGQQGKFYEFHDLLFENQPTWSNAPAPNAIFVQYADQLELDTTLFRRHMNAPVLRDKVRSELAAGRELGITGTPTFFLNGQRMEFDTYQSFVSQIAFAVDPTAAASTTAPATQGAPSVRFGL